MQIIAVAVHVQLLMAQQQRVCLTTSQRHGLFARSCWIIPLLLFSSSPFFFSHSQLLLPPVISSEMGQAAGAGGREEEEEEEGEDRLTVDVLFSLLKFCSFFDLNSAGCRHFPRDAVQSLWGHGGGDHTCFGTGWPPWMRSSRSWWWHLKDRGMACINELPGLCNSPIPSVVCVSHTLMK